MRRIDIFLFFGCAPLLLTLACNRGNLPFVNDTIDFILDERHEVISEPIRSMVFISNHELAMIVNNNRIISVDINTSQQETLLDTISVDIDSIQKNFLIPQYPDRAYSLAIQESYTDIIRFHQLFYNQNKKALYVMVEVLIPYEGNYEDMTAIFREKEYFIAELDVKHKKVVNLSFIRKEKDFKGAFPYFNAPFFADDMSIKMSAICKKK